MKICPECFGCKVIFPVNRENPLLTSFELPVVDVHKNPHRIRRLCCSKGEWEINQTTKGKGSRVTIQYNQHNLKMAEEGRSKVLNLAEHCPNYDDQDEYPGGIAP